MTLLKNLSTDKLLSIWEISCQQEFSSNLATVRGWIMDELEARYPDKFEAWLDSEPCYDETLRQYITQ